jgi:hypothetical protein
MTLLVWPSLRRTGSPCKASAIFPYLGQWQVSWLLIYLYIYPTNLYGRRLSSACPRGLRGLRVASVLSLFMGFVGPRKQLYGKILLPVCGECIISLYDRGRTWGLQLIYGGSLDVISEVVMVVYDVYLCLARLAPSTLYIFGDLGLHVSNIFYGGKEILTRYLDLIVCFKSYPEEFSAWSRHGLHSKMIVKSSRS